MLIGVRVVMVAVDWQDVMHHTMDIVGPDLQPAVNSNPWAAVYFVVFGFTMGFFILQLVRACCNSGV